VAQLTIDQEKANLITANRGDGFISRKLKPFEFRMIHDDGRSSEKARSKRPVTRSRAIIDVDPI